jgi:hypothetical protein
MGIYKNRDNKYIKFVNFSKKKVSFSHLKNKLCITLKFVEEKKNIST